MYMYNICIHVVYHVHVEINIIILFEQWFIVECIAFTFILFCYFKGSRSVYRKQDICQHLRWGLDH